MNQTITTKLNPTRNFLRILVCAFILLGLTATSAKAQTVIIGANSAANGTTTYPCPLEDYYYAMRAQYLYRAAELSAAGVVSGSNITNLGWVTNSTAITGHLLEGYSISLKNASLANLVTTAWETGTTLKYGPTNYSYASGTSGNVMFALTGGGFVYTGGDLIVEVCGGLSTGGYSSNPACQWTTGLTGTVQHTYRADAVNGCGNATLTNTGTVTVRPRLVLTYAGSTPCSGTPNPGNTLSTLNPVCAATSFTLSLQNNTTGTGVTYQWQSSPTGSTYTNISGATSATYTTTQSAATFYRCIVTCASSGLSGTSTPISEGLSTGASCLTYCASAATSTADDEIFNVSLGSLNNTSTCATTAPGPGSVATMYSNYRSGTGAPAAPNLTQLVNYSGNVTVGFCSGTSYTSSFAVYIDYNQNGLFTDAGEMVYNLQGFSAAVAGTAYSFNITIPVSATPGTTVMRVVDDEGSLIPGPCLSYTWGETEDYLVNIVATTGCTGTPTAGTTTSSANPVCAGVNFNLSLTGGTVAAGLTYQWQSSPTGSTYTNITGATSSVYTTTQSAATYYRAVVTCTSSGLSSTSTPLLVNQNAPLSCYCTPAVSTSALCCSMYISNITTTGGLSNINNSSVEGAGSYQNYSGSAIASQLAGSPVTITGTTSGYGMDFNVYIDYNDNGLFTDAGELVTTFGNTAPGAIGATFTVPAAAPSGTHRMRVRAEYYGSGYPAGPCTTLTYGETEDYGFTVILPVACSGTPTAGTASSSLSSVCGTGTTNLSLSGATSGTGLTYQWQQSFNSGAYADIAGATGTSYSISSWASTGTYAWHCVITCTNSGLSATSSNTSVTTVYAPASISPSTIGLCAGASATATASPSGATSYQWSGGSTATTPSISVSTAGTFTCTVTQGSCVTTATATAAVSPLPVITSATATPSSVCSGANSQLNATATGPAPGVNQYVFTPSSGTFTPLTGGTAEATILADDAVSAAISLGFTFNYGGVSYTQVVAGSNGDLFFGATGNTTTAPDLSTMTPRPYVAPLGDDMHGASGAASYTTTGAVGSRVFTFEWLNWRWYYTAATPTISFQVKLYEADGKIQFIYRQEATALGGTEGAVVGLAGVTAGTYLSLNNLGTSPTASSTVETTTINAKPANGQTYTFTPPSPTFSWSPSTFLSATNIANPMATAVTASTTYTVTATTFAGCTATATVPVTVNPSPVGNSSGSTTICSTGTTAISLGSSISGSTFSWTASLFSGSSTTGFSNSSGTSIAQTLTNTSAAAAVVRYVVTPTSPLGCVGATYNVDVTVNPKPTGSATPTSSSFCSGGTTSIALSGGGSYTWTVTGGSGSSACSSGCASTIAQTLTSTNHVSSVNVTYTITPISATGCIGNTFTSVVAVRPSPTVTATPLNSFVCSGSSNNINLSATTASTYTWTTSASSGVTGNTACSSSCTPPIHQTLSNSGSTTGYVTYTITPTSTAFGCAGAAVTASDSVGVTPSLTVTGPITLCTGSTYSPSLSSSVPANFTWASSVTGGSATGNTTCGGACGTIADMLSNGGTTASTIQYIFNASTYACSSPNQTVTVTVTPNTSIVCPGNITVNNDAGSCGAVVSFAATAFGSGTAITYSQNPGTLFAIGTTTVTATASSVCGPDQSCSFTVTVNDNEAPVISCPATANINMDAGACTSSASIGTATVSDNCSGATLSNDHSGSYSVGSTTVIWTALDASGNSSTCSQTVVVSDNQAPVISCPAGANLTTDAGACTSTGAIGSASATDNCSVSSITNDNAGPYSVGNTTVTWTATDVNGNTSACSQVVHVDDSEAPTVSCPSAVTLSADAGMCSSSASIGSASANDNCSGVSVSHSPAGPYNVGSTTVTWTATDASGNTTACTQIVTVTDNELPVISCPATASLNMDAGACSSTSSIGTATVADNCSGATVANNHTGSYPLGSTTVTWTATDASGNTSSCSQTVVVTDNQAPVVSCPATANLNTDAGACTSSSSAGTATATDNCSVASVTVDNAGPYSVGTTTVTWTAVDVNGNTSACSQAIHVADSEMPVISCPATANLSTDAGLSTSSASIGSASATDNCAGTTVSHSPAGPYSVGSTTVIWTATDASGNTAVCTQTVNVGDSEAPVISCPSSASINTNAGSCTSSSSIGTATATDNAPGVVVTFSPAGPYAVGNTTINWLATDASGNTAGCSQTVTVTDAEMPIINCPATANITTDLGLCTSTASIGTATGSDNCGAVTISYGPVAPYAVGLHTITWTATDANGNTSACTQSVNVTAPLIPVITCAATANISADAGLCSSTASIGTATALSSCSIVTVSGPVPAAPYALGSTVVTWTATDAGGSTSTCAQTVIVSDNEAPVVTPPADVTVCSLTTGATVSLGTASGTDNCTVSTITNNGPATYPFGTTTVTWTITDASGNTSAATQDVTVNPTPAGTASSEVICDGSSSNLDLAASMPAGTSFTWAGATTFGTVVTPSTCTSGCGTSINDVLSNLGTVHGTVVYTITPTSALGCVGAPYTASVTVGVTPATPGAISGPAVVCGLTTATYSVAAVTDATTYNWVITPVVFSSMTILSGQGTTSITVSIPAAVPTQFMTVTAGNGCGTSATQSLNITRKPLVPGIISGPTSACGITSATYSVVPVFGATSYTWVVPTGITITSPSTPVTGGFSTTTPSITVSIASTFAVGNLNVNAVNSCGSTLGTSIFITGKPPVVPGILSGPTNVCGMTSAAYSIPAVAYATGYTWSVPTWMHIISGGGTTAINVLFDAAPPASSTLSVAATNVCGTGVARSVTLITAAVIPGAITGPTTVCAVTTATFSVASLGAGYTYTWSLAMTGWSITSGAGTTQITVAGPATGVSAGGLVLVTSTNSCGATSGVRSKPVTYCHSPIINQGTDNSGASFSSVYPNPTATDFKIDVTTDFDTEITLQVYDVLGNLIISEKHQIASGTSTMNTNVENYKAGMYFVRLVDSNASTVYSQTVIKD